MRTPRVGRVFCCWFLIAASSLGWAAEPREALLKTNASEALHREISQNRLDDFKIFFGRSCEYRQDQRLELNSIYNECLLADLIQTYQKRVDWVESLIRSNYQARPEWGHQDLLAGFFNEMWVLDESGEGIKPILDYLVLRVAIANELKRFGEFLSANKSPEFYMIKRHIYPELSAYFGGRSIFSRVFNYSTAMDCKIQSDCKGGICQVRVIKECKETKNSLWRSLERSLTLKEFDIQETLNNLIGISENPSYLPSQKVFAAIKNSKILYEDLQKNVSSEEVLRWVKDDGGCFDSSLENSMTRLCTIIDQSLSYPVDVHNTDMIRSVISGGFLWEAQQILHRIRYIHSIRRNDLNEGSLQFVSYGTIEESEGFTGAVAKMINRDLESIYFDLGSHFSDYNPVEREGSKP